MAWIIRIFFIIAAPITALPVAEDSLKFGIVQVFVAISLMTALIGFGAPHSILWSEDRAHSAGIAG